MSEVDDDLIERPAEIPILDRIVKPSKQKDLADLLIKIIQTNEAEDTASLTEYDVDVSSATLRDIDEKLSAVLQTTTKEPKVTIPMLTEIADFPVIDGAGLPFQSRHSDGNPELPALPAMHSVNNDTAAANSAQQPKSANQECGPGEGIFSFADSERKESVHQQNAHEQEFDLGLDTSLKTDNQNTLLQKQLNQSTRQIIDELIAEHAIAIRAELEIRIDSLKEELLGELSSNIEPQIEIAEQFEPEGSDA